MAEATRDTLIEMALARISVLGSRNKAGYWLGEQLHHNDYTYDDATAIMLDYNAAAVSRGAGPYTEKEAIDSLNQAYRYQKKEAWSNGKENRAVNQQEKKYRQLRKAFPIYPFIRQDPVADPESIEKYKRQLQYITAFAGSSAETYLESRGIPIDIAKAAGCRFSSTWPFPKPNQNNPKGKAVWLPAPAVVFPIRDHLSKPIAAHGRRIEEWEGKNKITFGPEALGVFVTPGALDDDPIAVTEAPIDALTLFRAGLSAIALCGTRKLPQWVIEKFATSVISGRSRVVLLAFDADTAGDNASAAASAELYLVQRFRLRPTNAKDWNQVLMEQGLAVLQQIISSVIAAAEPKTYSMEIPLEQCRLCSSCKTVVSLNAFQDGGWHWYYCESCGDFGTVCLDPEPTYVPSNLVESVFSYDMTIESSANETQWEALGKSLSNSKQIEPDQEFKEIISRISAVDGVIRASLINRPLPIRISQGETISDVSLFSYAQARCIVSPSKFISNPSRDRLLSLGINISNS